MLIGIINKGYEQIHITFENNKLLFIKVNDNISLLDKDESINLLNELFGSNNLNFLEKENDYDVYLDLANNKRYFKDNIEDFKMFYLNNGKNATLCSNKDNNKLNGSKIFTMLLSGIIVPILLTKDSVDPYLIKIKHEYGITIKFEDDSIIGRLSLEDIPKYDRLVEPEQIKEYIDNSESLSSFDKNILYNEDYFRFVLNVIDIQSTLYDLPKRLDGINVVYYSDNEEPEAREVTSGYYTTGTNTIHIKEKYLDKLNQCYEVATHELVHLTQTGNTYYYLMEGLAEILSTEFYGSELNAYYYTVQNTKLLTEIIGPDAVLNSVFNHDNTLFEDSIKEYLDEKDSKELFELFKSEDIYKKDKKMELNSKVHSLLQKMLINKYNNNTYEIEAINLAYTNINKYFFNDKHENYYMTLEYNDNTIENKPVNSVVDYLLAENECPNVLINRIHYSGKEFLDNLDGLKQLYMTELLTEPIEVLDSSCEIDQYGSIKIREDTTVLNIDKDGNICINNTIINMSTIEKIVNNFSDVDFNITLNRPIGLYSISEALDNHFIGEVTFSNGKNVIIKDNIVNSQYTDVIKLPPISERFEIEYLNKGKSK